MKRVRIICRHKRERGFTLLEVLVAAAITALLVGFMVAVVNNVSGFWSRSSGRLSAAAQARYALDQLTLDLQSALYRDDGAVWFAADAMADPNHTGVWDSRPGGAAKPATALRTPLSYESPQLANATFGPAGTWLRFFTAKRGTNRTLERISAPIAVGWQIVRRTALPYSRSRDIRYFLHRSETTPEQTVQAGFDLRSATYDGPGSALRAPTHDAIVAENVIDFGVRCYARNATGDLVRVFPHAGEFSYCARNPPGVGAPEEQFPEIVEVCVRILTDEGARLIAGFEAQPQRVVRPPEYAADADYWWPLALANSQVFTRRLTLPGGEL